MPIVFEKTSQFNSLPVGTMERIIAEDHLLGRKFDSLEEALDQKWCSGFTLSEYGFYIGKVKESTPLDLPVVINEVEICVNIHYKSIPILVAKYEEEEEEEPPRTLLN